MDKATEPIHGPTEPIHGPPLSLLAGPPTAAPAHHLPPRAYLVPVIEVLRLPVLAVAPHCAITGSRLLARNIA